MSDLLRRLAIDDPFEEMLVGYDATESSCFWCGAPIQYSRHETFAKHKLDCPWLEARHILDLPIGRHGYEDE